MKPQALLLLLLLAALAVVGWFAMRGQETLAPRAVGGPSVPVAHLSGETTRPVTADAPEGGSADGTIGEAADPVRTMAPEAAAEASAAGAKTYRVRGRIVDGQGSPRAGLKLSAPLFRAFLDGGLEAADLPLPSGANARRSLECTTGTDGTFELQAPADRAGSLEVEDDDLVFREKSPQFASQAGDQDLGDLAVVRTARLQGIVQDEGGQPVAGVRVLAQLGPMGFDTESSATTGPDGAFSIGKLRPHTWTLRTESSRYQPTVERHDLAAEQQETGIVLVVKEGKAIAGRVIDDRGLGVAGMKVGSRRQEAVGGMELNRFSAGEATTTDADGRFSLAGLEGNAVTVRAFGPGHTSVTADKVAVGTGNLELRVQRYGIVEGVLVAADGSPIAGSRVSAHTADSPRSNGLAPMDDVGDLRLMDSMDGAAVTTDEHGRFALTEVRPGTVSVRASGKTHRPTRQDGVQVFPAQRVEGLRLVADAGAIVRAQVVDEDGKAIANAKVRVEKPGASGSGGMGFSMRTVSVGDTPDDIIIDGGQIGSGETDEQGIAVIMGLPAGDAVLKATHAEFAPAQAVSLTLPARGTVDGRLVLQVPGYLEVRVTNSDGSTAAAAHVVLEPTDGGREEKAVTDGEGVAHFGPLLSGDYTAALSLGPVERSIGGMSMVIGGDQSTIRSSARPVFVRAGKTESVDLRLPIMTRFTGRVIGVDGPVAGCQVELQSAAQGPGVPGFGGRTEKTGEDGTFAFDNVESGDYVVNYGKSTQAVKASIDLVVPPDTPAMQRELLLRTGTVRVKLQSMDDAEPIERAEVSLQRGGSSGSKKDAPQRVMMIATLSMDNSSGETNMMTVGNGRAFTDSDGEAVIEDVPVGEYTLRVEHRKFAPADKENVVVVERQLTDCGLIEMSAAGQVRGKVQNAAGDPVMSAVVERRVLGTEAWNEREVAMGGTYRLTGLAPGKYELRSTAIGESAGEPGVPVEVDVEAGKIKVVDLTVR